MSKAKTILSFIGVVILSGIAWNIWLFIAALSTLIVQALPETAQMTFFWVVLLALPVSSAWYVYRSKIIPNYYILALALGALITLLFGVGPME